jgi:hypothetical protein
VPLAPTTRRVAPATVEPESHLTLSPTWRASYRGVKTVTSMLFELVSGYRVSSGSGGLKNTRNTQRRCNSLSWFGAIRSLCLVANDPYSQEHPKSRGLQQSVKEESLVGVSSVLILRLPHHRWSLPLVREEGDGRMWWRTGSRCPTLGWLALGVERRQMEWSGVSSDRIRILSPLGPTLSLM